MDVDGSDNRDVEIVLDAGAWSSAVPDFEATCRRAAAAALATRRPGRPSAMAIVLSDDTTVQELNRRWRGKDAATNVLAFPTETPAEVELSRGAGPELPLGDVVVALETVLREATASGKPPTHHLAHLVIHGTLHLLGLDHADDDQAAHMEALEVQLLAGLGVPDPFAHEPTS